MKKAALGIAVLGVYVVYSLGIRHQQPRVPKPASLAPSNGNSGTGGTPSSGSSSTATYADGTYTGSVADAFYGNVQVSATISGGKLVDVKFLQYPDTHSTSVYINSQAMPYLKQEAIQAQSANVQIVSGATFTSQAFIQSLQNALNQAKS